LGTKSELDGVHRAVGQSANSAGQSEDAQDLLLRIYSMTASC